MKLHALELYGKLTGGFLVVADNEETAIAMIRADVSRYARDLERFEATMASGDYRFQVYAEGEVICGRVQD